MPAGPRAAMDKATFDDYIRRFNLEDDTAFDDYLHPQLHMQNGTLEFDGIDGMKHHYRDLIWGNFQERLEVKRFLTDGQRIAIQMYTHFTALVERADSLFGPVVPGVTFEFNGVIMYDLLDGLFRDILVAYNSFVRTDLDGTRTDLGIPH